MRVAPKSFQVFPCEFLWEWLQDKNQSLRITSRVSQGIPLKDPPETTAKLPQWFWFFKIFSWNIIRSSFERKFSRKIRSEISPGKAFRVFLGIPSREIIQEILRKTFHDILKELLWKKLKECLQEFFLKSLGELHPEFLREFLQQFVRIFFFQNLSWTFFRSFSSNSIMSSLKIYSGTFSDK